MPKKTLSFKAVLIMGVTIGIVVVIVAVIAIHMQQRRTLKASIEGTLPRMEEKTGWQEFITDAEGGHRYIIEKKQDKPENVVSAWDRLTYSKEGKKNYIIKRQRNGMFVAGMDTLTDRYILYNLRCDKKPRRYAIIKVFEVSRDGRTLDYGKIGSQKDWEDVPEETVIDRLAKIACP